MLKRSILLLQGVSSPFFEHLANSIQDSGYPVYKVNFCGGDKFFSSGIKSWDYRDHPDQFSDWLVQKLNQHNITDIILFGDTRKMHQLAIKTANSQAVDIHVFEEGYLRPHWLTLDKGGVNANSSLPKSAEWYKAQARHIKHYENGEETGYSIVPRVWHDIRYHLASFLLRPRYPHYQTHRPVSPLLEYAGWIKRLSKVNLVHKRKAERTIQNVANSDTPYYVLPLQLSSDAQIKIHSEFEDVTAVLKKVIPSFAQHAPSDSLLVIKNHPLDTGRVNYKKIIKKLGAQYRCKQRLIYIEAGHLPTLLRKTHGTVLVNSTVGMSALHHKSPLMALGKAIYDMPGLTFQGQLDQFWIQGERPERELYKALRNTIIHHTQINGDFYSTQGMLMAVRGSLKLLELPPVEQHDYIPGLSTAQSSSPPVMTANSPVYLMKERG